MSHTTRKLIDTLSGTGQVLRGDVPIATVKYGITIHQEMHHEGNETIPGLRDINGQLFVLTGEHDLIHDEELVLVLQDGRRARFYAHSGHVPEGDAQILINDLS